MQAEHAIDATAAAETAHSPMVRLRAALAKPPMRVTCFACDEWTTRDRRRTLSVRTLLGVKSVYYYCTECYEVACKCVECNERFRVGVLFERRSTDPLWRRLTCKQCATLCAECGHPVLRDDLFECAQSDGDVCEVCASELYVSSDNEESSSDCYSGM